ncbi:MAG: SGNH/GDSL hydrolase family protein [Candidatus Microsaccharimonas sp.]
MKTAIRGVLFSFILIMVFGASVDASDHWSWAQGDPKVVMSESARFDTYSQCPHYQVTRMIVSIDNPQKVCVHSEGMLQFVTFFLDGGEPRAAVGFGLGSDLYLLDNLCRGSIRCLYIPQTDSLVRRVYSGNNRYQSLVIPHLSRQLGRAIHSDGSVGYSIKDFAEEKSLGNDVSQLSIGTIGLSRNGQWAAIEIQDGSIAVVHIASGVTKQIWRTGQQYGFGHDPEMELAISNDGEYVAVMGENAGFLIIQSQSGCGVLAPTVMTSVENCPIAPVQTDHFMPSFRFGSHPEFDNEGGSLRFLAASYTLPPRFVVMRASGYEGGSRLSYLAMGDSFASGEGESNDSFYLAGTNDTHERCHTSRRSYPFLLSSSITEPEGLVKSVACSGAKIKDIVGDDTNYWGQANRLMVAGMTISNKLTMQTQALLGFLPGRIHQAMFYSYTYPRRATIGIGGNDAGLMDKLKTCAMPERCEWVKDATARRKTALEVERLYDKLLGLFRKLKNESPTTALQVVGYPLVIRPYGDCDPITSTLLDSEERLFMDQGIRLLNDVLKRAAVATQIPFIDIQDSLVGHRLCEHTSPAINSLRLGDDISPIRALPSFLLIGAESFHPNPVGHQMIAKAIDSATLQSASGSCGECASQLSDYWTYGAVIDDESRYASDFLDDTTLSDEQKDMMIKLEAFSLLPHSSATVEVRSESSKLGTFITDESGALEVSVRLPEGLGEGYHTVHIHGTSYTHQSVDYYQVISYRNEIPIHFFSPVIPSLVTLIPPIFANNVPNQQVSEVLGSSSLPSTTSSPPHQRSSNYNRWLGFVVLAIALVGGLGIVLIIRKVLFRTRDRGG